VVNAGIGPGDVQEFYLNDDFILSSFTRPAFGNFQKLAISTIPLEELIAKYRPSVLACDIEGAEMEYILPEKLNGISTVMIELHPHIYGEEGVDRMIHSFAEAGFGLIERKNISFLFARP